MRHSSRFLPSLLLACTIQAGWAQSGDTRYVARCIGFWNLENLYDTLDSPHTDDAEFLPGSAKQWGGQRFRESLAHKAKVLGEMGTDIDPEGLACFGVSEVEDREVLQDLLDTPPLDKRGYRIVEHPSPDRRGVDVAFVYDPARFTLLHERAYPLRDPSDTLFRTRDQLVVTGLLDGDTTSIIVNHWPSRYGGEKRSLPKRALAARLGRRIIDSLLSRNADAHILYMGDLNDDPVDPSVRKYLNTTGNKAQATGTRLFNPMVDLYRQGIGSLAWRDSWNLFDQIILSPAMVTGKGGDYRYYGARVYNKPYMRQTEGRYEGYPLRTYVGDQYQGGYSDHFPVFVVLVKEAKGAAGQ